LPSSILLATITNRCVMCCFVNSCPRNKNGKGAMKAFCAGSGLEPFLENPT